MRWAEATGPASLTNSLFIQSKFSHLPSTGVYAKKKTPYMCCERLHHATSKIYTAEIYTSKMLSVFLSNQIQNLKTIATEYLQNICLWYACAPYF